MSDPRPEEQDATVTTETVEGDEKEKVEGTPTEPQTNDADVEPEPADG